MAAKPFMKLYISDYLIDTQHLSALEHGAYLLLIMTYFQTGKSLPDNDQKLARFCKLSVTKFLKVKPTLKEFFSISCGEWVHKRIEKELEEMAQKSDMARVSAHKRWVKNDEKHTSKNDANAMRTHSERNAKAMLTDTDTETDTDSDTDSDSDSETDTEQKYTSTSSPQILEIFEFWKLTTGHKKAVLDDKRKSKIVNALKKYSADDLKKAIAGNKMDKWHSEKGVNELTYILRDSAHIERFLCDGEKACALKDFGYVDPT